VPANPASKGTECTCAACELYKADVDTVFAKMAAGELPKEFCPDTPAEKVTWLQQHPLDVLRAADREPSERPRRRCSTEVKARFADKSANDAERTRLLDVVAAFPQKANAGLTLALWQSAPSAFHTEHLTVFASGGPEALSAELEKRAKSEVLAAAYFGVRGNDCGRKTLQAAARRGSTWTKGDVIEPALGALGMAGLGDSKPFREDAERRCATPRSSASTRTSSSRPRSFALLAEFFGKVAANGSRAELGWLGENLSSPLRRTLPQARERRGRVRRARRRCTSDSDNGVPFPRNAARIDADTSAPAPECLGDSVAGRLGIRSPGRSAVFAIRSDPHPRPRLETVLLTLTLSVVPNMCLVAYADYEAEIRAAGSDASKLSELARNGARAATNRGQRGLGEGAATRSEERGSAHRAQAPRLRRPLVRDLHRALSISARSRRAHAGRDRAWCASTINGWRKRTRASCAWAFSRDEDGGWSNQATLARLKHEKELVSQGYQHRS
jgi:hypothetical protein